MTATATKPRAERLIGAAVDIHAAAHALGDAYRDFTAVLDEYRRDAWQQAGDIGQADIRQFTDEGLIAEETAGALVAAGLAPVIERARAFDIHAVEDLPDRWADRVRRGNLATSRRIDPANR